MLLDMGVAEFWAIAKKVGNTWKFLTKKGRFSKDINKAMEIKGDLTNSKKQAEELNADLVMIDEAIGDEPREVSAIL